MVSLKEGQGDPLDAQHFHAVRKCNAFCKFSVRPLPKWSNKLEFTSAMREWISSTRANYMTRTQVHFVSVSCSVVWVAGVVPLVLEARACLQGLGEACPPLDDPISVTLSLLSEPLFPPAHQLPNQAPALTCLGH